MQNRGSQTKNSATSRLDIGLGCDHVMRGLTTHTNDKINARGIRLRSFFGSNKS
jgi:hypothetical protein